MASDAANYENADFAVLCEAWPDSRDEQDALLRCLPPSCWTLRPRTGFAGCFYENVASRTLETSWGQRWFHVWRLTHDAELLVMKQPAPQRPLVVACALRVAGQGIEATFTFLSGRVLGTQTFENIYRRNALLLEHLEVAAEEHALQQGLLETSYQEAVCQLEGFARDLPSGLLLWWANTVDAESLQEWLAYLQSLSEEELQLWDVHQMDDATSSSDSAEETAGHVDSSTSSSDSAEETPGPKGGSHVTDPAKV